MGTEDTGFPLEVFKNLQWNTNSDKSITIHVNPATIEKVHNVFNKLDIRHKPILGSTGMTVPYDTVERLKLVKELSLIDPSISLDEVKKFVYSCIDHRIDSTDDKQLVKGVVLKIIEARKVAELQKHADLEILEKAFRHLSQPPDNSITSKVTGLVKGPFRQTFEGQCNEMLEAVTTAKTLREDNAKTILEELKKDRPDNEKIMKLLREGADLTIKDASGKTLAEHLEQVNFDFDTLITLTEAEGNLTIVYEWAKSLAGGAEIVTEKEKNTRNQLLFWAIEHSETDLVKLLIEAGADSNAKNKDGNTPLHLAAQNKDFSMIFMLIDKGADVKATNTAKETPFQNIDSVELMTQAILHSNKTCVQALSQANICDISEVDEQGNTFMHLAARANSFNVIMALYHAGLDINTQNNEGYSPLHIAAQEGFADSISTLCSLGANVNRADSNGRTPLHYAVDEDKHEAVLTLLTFGATFGPDVNDVDSRGWTPLHIATQKDFAEGITALCNRGADVNKADLEGWTPLHDAAEKGYDNAIQALLKFRADVNNATPKDGWTPLHLAAKNGHTQAVNTLIKAGANINATTLGESIPLQTAIVHKKNAIPTLILNGSDLFKKNILGTNSVEGRDPSGNTALHLVGSLLTDEDPKVKAEAEKACVALLEAGANTEEVNKSGEKPKLTRDVLNLARKHSIKAKQAAEWVLSEPSITDPYNDLKKAITVGNIKTIHAAIESGADIHMLHPKTGNSLFHDAVANAKNGAVIVALVEKGASLDAPNHNGETPLQIAILNGNIQAFEALVRNGADCSQIKDMVDKDQNTVLHLAVRSGNAPLIRDVINSGVELTKKNTQGKSPLDEVDAYGNTALHWAVCLGEASMALKLLQSGADPSKNNSDSKSPLNLTDTSLNSLCHWAVQEKDDVSLKVLIEKHAHIDSSNDSGETPLFLAVVNNNTEAVNLLRAAGAKSLAITWKVDDLGIPKDYEEPLSALRYVTEHKQIMETHPDVCKAIFKQLEQTNLSKAAGMTKELWATYHDLYFKFAKEVEEVAAPQPSTTQEVPINHLLMLSEKFQRMFAGPMRHSEKGLELFPADFEQKTEEVPRPGKLTEEVQGIFINYLNNPERPIAFTKKNVDALLKLARFHLLIDLEKQALNFKST